MKKNRPIILDEENDSEIFNVDYIISDKIENGKLYYLIK